jgi:hypothetical protein
MLGCDDVICATAGVSQSVRSSMNCKTMRLKDCVEKRDFQNLLVLVLILPSDHVKACRVSSRFEKDLPEI